MAISCLPTCSSRRFLPLRGCSVALLPSSSLGSSASISSSILAAPSLPSPAGFLALRAVTGGSQDPGLLRRPLVSSEEAEEEEEAASGQAPKEADADGGGVDGGAVDEVRRGSRSGRRNDDWVDWEDQILEDTVPLVSFVRMILHSGKYENGVKLSPEHEKAIVERLLPYHPEFEKKIGCGIDFITIGYHPDYNSSRCLFIVRKDGELVDFSYWKCIKGLIRKRYPLYADSFILRHFRRRRHNNDR